MSEQQPMARAITLVRHGRTAYNAAHRIQGSIDIPLDTTGRWQVARTGEALRAELDPQRPIPLVVASDLGRAFNTARAFADPLNIPVHTDERLRERNFGQWEGMSMQELADQFPQDYAAWTRKEGGELRHGAETHEHCAQRGLAAVEEWSQKAGPERDLYVFSHGAMIGNLMQKMLGLAIAHADYTALGTMDNAHWARVIPAHGTGPAHWMLTAYNMGPNEARTAQWHQA